MKLMTTIISFCHKSVFGTRVEGCPPTLSGDELCPIRVPTHLSPKLVKRIGYFKLRPASDLSQVVCGLVRSVNVMYLTAEAECWIVYAARYRYGTSTCMTRSRHGAGPTRESVRQLLRELM